MGRLSDSGIRDLAAIGAKQRLKQLAEEMAALREFLRKLQPLAAQKAPKRTKTAKQRRPRKARKPSREVTHEERQAISERMKRYWAKRRGKPTTKRGRRKPKEKPR